MMRSSIRLFRVAGIDIGVHYTWIFIFGLITWILAQSYFPFQYPNWSTGAYWAAGVVAALILFVSVLLHELAHSLVARARGMSVNSITLFIFGGVSNLEEEPEKPGIEFWMAIVGPLTSLVLAGVFWGLSFLISDKTGFIYAIVGYLAWVNLILALFNLIPGFPLDGGRVLRSIIWHTTGNLKRATDIAAVIGKTFSWILIIYGVYQIFWVNLLNGVWIIFIGWFLGNAADASRRELSLREHLTSITVRSIMNSNPDIISPDNTVEELVNNIFYKHHNRAVPVCRDERLLGIVTIKDVKAVPQSRWPETKIEQIMTTDPLYAVTPDDSIKKVMQMLAEHDINQVLVKVEGQCGGLISRADIINHLELNQELKMGR